MVAAWTYMDRAARAAAVAWGIGRGEDPTAIAARLGAPLAAVRRLLPAVADLAPVDVPAGPVDVAVPAVVIARDPVDILSAAAPEPAREPAGPCDIEELTAGRCRFPLWLHGARPGLRALYCGAAAAPGSSWCVAHRDVCACGETSAQRAARNAAAGQRPGMAPRIGYAGGRNG